MDEKLNLKNLIIIFSSIIVSTILLFTLAYLILFPSDSGYKNAVKAEIDSSGNQIIVMKAKNGFEPKISQILPGKPLILKVDTNNTYDCSSTINIPKLGISSTLPASGEKEFDIPPQTAGAVLDGTCSMGQFNFKIIVQPS